jgi:hypothetical protein
VFASMVPLVIIFCNQRVSSSQGTYYPSCTPRCNTASLVPSIRMSCACAPARHVGFVSHPRDSAARSVPLTLVFFIPGVISMLSLEHEILRMFWMLSSACVATSWIDGNCSVLVACFALTLYSDFEQEDGPPRVPGAPGARPGANQAKP